MLKRSIFSQVRVVGCSVAECAIVIGGMSSVSPPVVSGSRLLRVLPEQEFPKALTEG